MRYETWGPYYALLSAFTIMPESKNGIAKKTRRSHSFGGCETCRRRHVKCDQIRPSCLTCKAVGVDCAGYPKDLKWVPTSKGSSTDTGTASASNPLSARRHLYSGNDLPAFVQHVRGLNIFREITPCDEYRAAVRSCIKTRR